MSPQLIAQVKQMILQGYGAQGITQNSPATLKQANAVFASVRAAHDENPMKDTKQATHAKIEAALAYVRSLLSDGYHDSLDDALVDASAVHSLSAREARAVSALYRLSNKA